MSILRDLERFINARGRVSLAEAAQHFDTAPAALDAMVDRLVARGRLTRDVVTCGPGCGNCSGCVRADGPVDGPPAMLVILTSCAHVSPL